MSNPSRIIGLSPVPSAVQAASGTGISHRFDRTTLSLWERVRPSRRASLDKLPAELHTATYKEKSSITVCHLSHLLAALEEMSYPDEQTWLVVRYGGHDLALGGILGLIDNGALRLRLRPDGKPIEADEEYFAKPSSTLCVLSDPPIILDLVLRGTRPLTVLSLLNWLNKYTARKEDLAPAGITRAAAIVNQSLADIDNSLADARDIAKTVCGLIDSTEKLGCERFGFTAGGTAKRLWTDTHRGEKVEPHQIKPIRQLERAAFKAGECRPFRIGKIAEKVHLVDVNSLYPYLMASRPMPYHLIEWREQCTWDNRMTVAHGSRSIAEVWLDNDRIEYPVRMGNKLAFVNGQHKTVLCGPELAEALQLGLVKRIGRYGTYRLANLFGPYVETLYNRRLEARASGDDDTEAACKMLLNSLFGKFGQRLSELQIVPGKFSRDTFGSVVIANLNTRKTHREYYVGGLVMAETEPKELVSAFPAISAWITAWGRQYMRRIREFAGTANVYYQGIDSLLVNDRGLANLNEYGLLHQDKIGKLKLKESAENVDIIGGNAYEIGGRRVIQGLPSGLTEIEPGMYQVPQVPRLESIIRGGIPGIIDVSTVPFRTPRYVHVGQEVEDGWLLPVEIAMQVPPVHAEFSADESLDIAFDSQVPSDADDIERFFASRSLESFDRYAELIRRREGRDLSDLVNNVLNDITGTSRIDF